MVLNSKPYISVIIPVYNGKMVIGRCLESIFLAKIIVPFEVIVVDDGSVDDTINVVKSFPCKYFRIDKSGVAAARNFGIHQAKGDIIFFFDADVKVNTCTIENFLKHFNEDKDAYIIQGRWDVKSLMPTFSSQFQLLKYTYNFINIFKGVDRIAVANLETGCLAIRAEVFQYFDGFDERYKFAGGEEHEFGLRLLKRYSIFYYSDLFVEHGFGNIFKSLRKIYMRTVNFSLLSFKMANDKVFLNMHKNSVPVYDKISILIIFLLVCSIPVVFFNTKIAFHLFIFLLSVYVINVFKFTIYLTSKKNIFFALLGVMANFIIMLPRLFGILKAGFIFYILRKKEFKI